MTDPTLLEQALWIAGVFTVSMSVIVGAAYVHYRISTKGFDPSKD